MLPGATDSFRPYQDRNFTLSEILEPPHLAPATHSTEAVQTDYRNRGQVVQAFTFGST
jgi:hypothetical protein